MFRELSPYPNPLLKRQKRQTNDGSGHKDKPEDKEKLLYRK